MKTLLLLVCIILNNISIGQNLVPNPSFEDMTSCPYNHCQIYKASGWFPVGFTPDYYHACNQGLWSVPGNLPGFQYASTGVAYAGLASLNGSYWCREYIGIKLTESLVPFEKYYVSFKVSLADESMYAMDHLGALFSVNSYEIYAYNCTSFDTFYPNNNPHIYTSDIITDTANWIEIVGSFTPIEAYDYINIGNFFNDNNTQMAIFNPNGTCIDAYYYIDDIYVGINQPSSIDNLNEDKIQVRPNPCYNEVSVTIAKIDLPVDICLFTQFGILLQTYRMSEESIVLNLKDYPSGIYFICIRNISSLPVKIVVLPNSY